MKLDICEEYYACAKVWKEFFKMEVMEANQVEKAYSYLANTIKPKTKIKIVEKWN